MWDTFTATVDFQSKLPFYTLLTSQPEAPSAQSRTTQLWNPAAVRQTLASENEAGG